MNNKLVAEHLKKLRKKNDLSHEKLSEALKEKYGTNTSAQVLKNYEKPTLYNDEEYQKELEFNKNTKLTAVAGMRIETLFMLADFYNVSSDYLLGLSGLRTMDANLRSVCEYTGLSENAVRDLKYCNKTILAVLSALIEDYENFSLELDGTPVLSSIGSYMLSKPSNKITLINMNGSVLRLTRTPDDVYKCKKNNNEEGYFTIEEMRKSGAIMLTDEDLASIHLFEIQKNIQRLKRERRGDF